MDCQECRRALVQGACQPHGRKSSCSAAAVHSRACHDAVRRPCIHVHDTMRCGGGCAIDLCSCAAMLVALPAAYSNTFFTGTQSAAVDSTPWREQV
eukprot:361929-Chlamydomonas_euryale.AAC.6